MSNSYYDPGCAVPVALSVFIMMAFSILLMLPVLGDVAKALNSINVTLNKIEVRLGSR